MSIMLDNPLHIPDEADGKLLGKIMADQAELSIDNSLNCLNVSREEQKTVVKEPLARCYVMANLPTGFGKSKH